MQSNPQHQPNRLENPRLRSLDVDLGVVPLLLAPVQERAPRLPLWQVLLHRLELTANTAHALVCYLWYFAVNVGQI